MSDQDLTAAPVATASRYCPRCSTNTDAVLCPNDGSPTFIRGLVGTPGFRIGDVISGRYRIQGVLGQGGFGAVYEAEHVMTGQAAAVKVMTGEKGQLSEQMVQRFLQEARVTARLIHPNTVRIYDFGQTDQGVLFMAMERLRGPTLEDRMAQGPLPQDEAVGIAVQVLRSLAEAHAAGLVHRDLKPANIILHEVPGEASVVKVLDFGIARTGNSAITQTGVALGTPLFMSPEQGRGDALDARTDLYALGCILYACVAGRPPFEDTNPVVILMKHQLDPLPDLHTHAKVPLSEAFIELVLKSTAKLPNDRFATAQAMREALEAIAPSSADVLPMGEVVQAAAAAPTMATAVSASSDDEPTRVYGMAAMPDDDPPAPPVDAGQRPSSSRLRAPSRSQHPRAEVVTSPGAPSDLADDRMAIATAEVPAAPPRQRPPSATQLPRAAVDAAESPVTVVVQSRPRRPLLWASLAGVAVGLLAVAGWEMIQRTPAPTPEQASVPAQPETRSETKAPAEPPQTGPSASGKSAPDSPAAGNAATGKSAPGDAVVPSHPDGHAAPAAPVKPAALFDAQPKPAAPAVKAGGAPAKSAQLPSPPQSPKVDAGVPGTVGGKDKPASAPVAAPAPEAEAKPVKKATKPKPPKKTDDPFAPVD